MYIAFVTAGCFCGSSRKRQPPGWSSDHTTTSKRWSAAIDWWKHLLQTTLETGSQHGMNLVVFGGGFASTLVAFLVHSVFEVCCLLACVKQPSACCMMVWHVAQPLQLCTPIGLEVQWSRMPHASQQERCAAVFVRLPGTTDADFSRAQYLASFLGACRE